MNKKFYEKFAWIIFLLIGIMILIGAIPHTLGINTDPALVKTISGQTINDLKLSNPMHFNLYKFYFSGGGLSDLGVAFFIIIISIFSYRTGQKWAWFSFWFIPLWFLFWILISWNLPAEPKSSLIPPLIIFIALSIVGLLLPVRIFFPKKTNLYR